MIYKKSQDLQLSPLGMGAMRLPQTPLRLCRLPQLGGGMSSTNKDFGGIGKL